MNNDLIAEGRRLLDAATPGPWSPRAYVSEPETFSVCREVSDETGSYTVVCPSIADELVGSDAELIVWARNNLPALLDEVSRWREFAEDRWGTTEHDDIDHKILIDGLAINLDEYGDWGSMTLKEVLSLCGVNPGDDLGKVIELSERFAEAKRLLEYALHLRMNGENAPGGSETWDQWDSAAEKFLRSGLDGDL